MVFLSRSRQVFEENIATFFILSFLSALILTELSFGFSLVVFLITIILGVLLTFLYPRAGLFAGVILTVLFERFYTLQPIYIGNIEHKLYAADIILAVVIISAFLQLISGKAKFQWKTADSFLILFFGYITAMLVLTYALSEDKNVSTAFSTWKNYFFYGLLYFAIPLLLNTKEQLMRFGKFFLIASVLASTFTVIGIARGEGLWTQYTPLSTSGIRIIAFPHAFYFSMALIVSLAMAWYWKQKSNQVFWVNMMIAIWSVGILGSLMRHLWLGLGFAIIAMYLMMFSSEQKKWFLGKQLLIFSVLAAGIFVILFYTSMLAQHSSISKSVSGIQTVVTERIVSIGNSSDESMSWRNVAWKNAFGIFSGSPIFGLGFGVKVPVEIDSYHDFVEIRNIHNSWIAMLVQTGLVGFSLFGFFLLFLVYRLFRKRYDSLFLDSAKVAVLGIFAFHSVIFLSQPYLETNLLGIFFWLNVGVMRSLLEYNAGI